MSAVGTLGGRPACEIDKLIIQVIGKHHPTSQKLVIWDEKGKEKQEWLTRQDKPENIDNPQCSSVLHVWDWSKQPKRLFCLEVATQKGKPIRLPLFDEPCVTPRQTDAQWNQIVPVVPLVALPGAKSAYDLGTPVTCRPGRVYVFYRDQLWRELEVIVSDNQTRFHDIDVASYRTAQGFKPGARSATGVALEDLWLPASWNNQPVGALRLCFSEVPLSAARLEYLEKHPEEIAQRCQSFDLRASVQDFKSRFQGEPDGMQMLDFYTHFDAHDHVSQANGVKANVARRNLDGRSFPLTVVAPQRPRAQGFEYLLDHPARYLCDLSGQFPVLEAKRAAGFLASADQGEQSPSDTLLETTAVADALGSEVVPAGPAATDKTQPPSANALWEAQPALSDVLAPVRPRQLCGILLEDPRYRLRHLETRIDSQKTLLQQCARHAATHPHHGSALLVQQLVVARQLRGQANPLHRYLETLSHPGRRSINRSTALVERVLAWQSLSTAQRLLCDSLREGLVIAALADHLSLDGYQYLAALHATTRTLAALALGPARLDPLAPAGDLFDATGGPSPAIGSIGSGQRFLAELQKNRQSPLHRMLWPDVDEALLCRAYEPTPGEPNPGTGQFRGAELAKLEGRPAPPWRRPNCSKKPN
ncbi:MAG: hypothetical protein GAK45_00200 [Pseudomonas citronellolis]|nr:MAG: hypothetical protein GAK45_00200 [Pseudomonas citronellolis]